MYRLTFIRTFTNGESEQRVILCDDYSTGVTDSGVMYYTCFFSCGLSLTISSSVYPDVQVSFIGE